MPGLVDPYTLKGVTLRNRIAMSPMTTCSSVEGKMNDHHVNLVPEQWGWWLKNVRGHAPSIGWPEVAEPAIAAVERSVA